MSAPPTKAVQIKNFKSAFLRYPKHPCLPGNQIDELAKPPRHREATQVPCGSRERVQVTLKTDKTVTHCFHEP